MNLISVEFKMLLLYKYEISHKLNPLNLKFNLFKKIWTFIHGQLIRKKIQTLKKFTLKIINEPFYKTIVFTPF